MMEAAEFAKLAREFMDFLDGAEELSREEFFVSASILLPRLYAASVELSDSSYELEDVDEEWEDAPFPRPNPAFGDKLGHYNFYESLAPYGDDEYSGVSLYDDLCDIYGDLGDGLQFYDRDLPNSALFRWRTGFDSHYGHHLASAMHVIHYVIADGIREDDPAAAGQAGMRRARHWWKWW